MTRDKAEKIAKSFWGNSAGDAIDTLEALGMLKLDEPKSVEKKIYDLCYGKINDGWLKTELDKAGLKIVEK